MVGYSQGLRHGGILLKPLPPQPGPVCGVKVPGKGGDYWPGLGKPHRQKSALIGDIVRKEGGGSPQFRIFWRYFLTLMDTP